MKEEKIKNVSFVKIDDDEVIIRITCPMTYCCAGETFEVKFFISKSYPKIPPRIFFVRPNIPKHRDVDEAYGYVLVNLEPEIRFRGLITIIFNILRSARTDWKRWRGLKAIDSVDQSYEIPNGLLGTQRSVLLSLFRIVGENAEVNGKRRDKSVKTLMGLCAEQVVLKTHRRFVHTRRTLLLDIPVVLRDYIYLPATLRVRRTDAVDTVGADLEARTGLDRGCLVYYKKETLLEKTRTFLDYDFRNGVKLTVTPSYNRFKKGPLSVTVVSIVGESRVLHVDPRNLVESVMMRAEGRRCYLVYHGKELQEGSTLQELNIKDGAELYVVLH